MERRDRSFRPEKTREFDTGQLFQEFRFSDIARGSESRPIFFTPEVKVYLSSKSTENGTSYRMVLGRPMQRGDILHSFFHFLSVPFDQSTLASQIAGLQTESDGISRDTALIKDVISQPDTASLSNMIVERLTTIDYCWNQLKRDKKYLRQLQKEEQSEVPRIVLAQHAEGLTQVMRNHPELWKPKTSRRSIGNATRVRAISRLAQLGDPLREAVFNEEFESQKVDEQELTIISRITQWHNGIPLIMGNGEFGVLLRSNNDLNVTDLGNGLHRATRGGEEVVIDLFGEDKHLADIYPANDRFVIPALSWEKSKLGARSALLNHGFYTGPSTVETMSKDERIRVVRTFAPWQINMLAGLMSLGVSRRYEPLHDATSAEEIVETVLREKNHILNNSFIENAERLAVF